MSISNRTLAPGGPAAALWALLVVSVPSFGTAGTCTVPGSHATLQAAVDDPGCAVVELAAQAFPESLDVTRTSTLRGPAEGGATIEGQVRVRGEGTVATLEHILLRSGCPPAALLVLDRARVRPSAVEVEHGAVLPCPEALFADGFESGDTAAWH